MPSDDVVHCEAQFAKEAGLPSWFQKSFVVVNVHAGR